MGRMGTPSSCDSFWMSMEVPLARTSSIMFSAITIGSPSSMSCIER